MPHKFSFDFTDVQVFVGERAGREGEGEAGRDRIPYPENFHRRFIAVPVTFRQRCNSAFYSLAAQRVAQYVYHYEKRSPRPFPFYSSSLKGS